MKEEASKMAKENLEKSARMIWNEINIEIDRKYQSKYKTIIKLTMKEVLNIFATIRKELQPSKIISKINDPKIAGIGGGDDRLFFQFNFDNEICEAKLKQKGKLLNMLVFVHPDFAQFFEEIHNLFSSTPHSTLSPIPIKNAQY
ncbi:hypothetical protein HZS_6048 [Henneguya salminicola]|nr:hypothetical protein HZS_6048 [Henneguya salminicola]